MRTGRQSDEIIGTAGHRRFSISPSAVLCGSGLLLRSTRPLNREKKREKKKEVVSDSRTFQAWRPLTSVCFQ